MKYAIWNNKGGVGKTFISFVLSTEYAHTHPDKKVLVVDMCPQANLSDFSLKPGQHEVHEERPQVNPEPLNRYKEAIAEIIKQL